MIHPIRKGAFIRSKIANSRDSRRVLDSITAAARNRDRRSGPAAAPHPPPPPSPPPPPETEVVARPTPFATTAMGASVNNVSNVAPVSPPTVDWEAVRKGLRLTLREVEVIQGIWAGHQFQQIARSLSISGHTCETHWRHIRTKLGVQCRVGVVHAVYGVMLQT